MPEIVGTLGRVAVAVPDAEQLAEHATAARQTGHDHPVLALGGSTIALRTRRDVESAADGLDQLRHREKLPRRGALSTCGCCGLDITFLGGV